MEQELRRRLQGQYPETQVDHMLQAGLAQLYKLGSDGIKERDVYELAFEGCRDHFDWIPVYDNTPYREFEYYAECEIKLAISEKMISYEFYNGKTDAEILVVATRLLAEDYSVDEMGKTLALDLIDIYDVSVKQSDIRS